MRRLIALKSINQFKINTNVAFILVKLKCLKNLIFAYNFVNMYSRPDPVEKKYNSINLSKRKTYLLNKHN